MVGITSSDDFHFWGEKLLALLIATSKTSTGLDNELQVHNYSRTLQIDYLAPPWWGFVLILSCYESKCKLKTPCGNSGLRQIANVKGNLGCQVCQRRWYKMSKSQKRTSSNLVIRQLVANTDCAKQKLKLRNSILIPLCLISVK